jgi:hypothetical protein
MKDSVEEIVPEAAGDDAEYSTVDIVHEAACR